MKISQRGFAHIELLIIAVAVAGVGGIGYYVVNQNKGNSAQHSVTDDSNTTVLPESLNGLKTAEEIKTTASASLNGATIVSIELEKEGSVLVYKVKLSDGRVLSFNATTGAAEKTENENETESETEDDNDSLPSNLSVTISIDQARRIAQDRRPGKTINKIEIDNDGGKVYYSVRFTDSGKVEVDATTGAIRKVEAPETQNEENKEDGGSSNDD